ncbi:MAG: intein-containing recombinase RecA, partial [Acidimicrobiales bacterium]
NVTAFADAIPMWGPKGTTLTVALADPGLATHRGSQRQYLPDSHSGPVLAYLRHNGVTPSLAASMVGEIAGSPVGGLRAVLGTRRLRRDRLERLAEALDSSFLRQVLA